MTSPSFRDMANLSAYLDGQFSPSERVRLESRLQVNPDLSAALKELRWTRTLLRHTPLHRAPRNFRLTPRMAGIRPPVPRLVPVFSWASAVAMVLFIFTLATSLVGETAVGTNAPMLAAAPSRAGNVSQPLATLAPVVAAPATLAPAAPAVPVAATPAPEPPQTNPGEKTSPTPETYVALAPNATLPGVGRLAQPPSVPKPQPKPLNPWLVIWPGLGVLLGALALLVWWLNRLAFRRKNPPG